LFAFVGLTVTSCEVDTEPTNSVSGNLAYDNADNAELVLNGTWSYLWDTYATNYQTPGYNSLFLASDALGNDVAMHPTKYGYATHYQFAAINSTSFVTVTGVWTLAYKAIDNLNNVIAKIDETPGSDEQKDRIKGQALALRGYLYLNFATFWNFAYSKDPNALSVPIYTEPTTKDTQGHPRSKLSEVYKQAETDLLAALPLIGDYNRGGSKHKINKDVVNGILARLYLHTDEWSKAQTYAAAAHSSYPFMAKGDYSLGFNDYTNAEWLWGHGQTGEQSVASYSFHYKDVTSSSSYYYSYAADPYFKDLFVKENSDPDEGDVRTSLFEWDTARFVGSLRYKKFLFRAGDLADIVLLRKAELVLIEAEAYARIGGKSSEAITALNSLRTARGAETPDLSGKSQTELIEVILLERRKELFGEGCALSDILRNQKAVERREVPAGTLVPGSAAKVQGHTVVKFPDGSAFEPNSVYYLFAIPATETTNNPNL
jgi:hypothetical protein